MKEKSRLWVTPTLIVLARGNSEESVLTSCKNSFQGVGPNTVANQGCWDSSKPGTCDNCADRGGKYS
jgi:hypothetical protein